MHWTPIRGTWSVWAIKSNQGVQRILDITGLVPVLPVVSDRAAAIDYARAGVRG